MRKIENKNKKLKGKLEICETNLLIADTMLVKAIGYGKLKGQWAKSTVSVQHLEEAIKAIKALKIEKVDIVYTMDMPLIIGKAVKDQVNGIFIAPRIED